MMTRRDLIREEYSDSDGYWIYLVKGYQWDGMHMIHESSKTKAYASLRDVESCNCEQCAGSPTSTE